MKNFQQSTLAAVAALIVLPGRAQAEDWCSGGPYKSYYVGYETGDAWCASKWKDGAAINGIQGWASGDSVNGLEFQYTNGVPSERFGKMSGDKVDWLQWDTTKDSIESITAWPNGYSDKLRVSSIKIKLTDGREWQLGSPPPNTQGYDSPVVQGAGILMGAYGGQGDAIDRIGFNMMDSAIKDRSVKDFSADEGSLNSNNEALKGQQPSAIDSFTQENWTGENQTYSVSRSIEKKREWSTTRSSSKTFGGSVGASLDFGLPIWGLGGSINTEYHWEETNSYESTEAGEDITKLEFSVAGDIPKGEAIYCESLAFSGKYDLDYTSTIDLELQSGSTWSYTEKGTMKGVAWSKNENKCITYKKGQDGATVLQQKLAEWKADPDKEQREAEEREQRAKEDADAPESTSGSGLGDVEGAIKSGIGFIGGLVSSTAAPAATGTDTPTETDNATPTETAAGGIEGAIKSGIGLIGGLIPTPSTNGSATPVETNDPQATGTGDADDELTDDETTTGDDELDGEDLTDEEPTDDETTTGDDEELTDETLTDADPTEEDPTGEDPTEEDPTEEDLTDEDLTTDEDPTEEDPTEEDLTDEDLTDEDLTTDEDPTDEEPTDDETTTGDDEELTDETLADADPTEEDPTEEDPTEEDPTEEDPTEEDPTEEDPTEEDPTEEDPTEEDPTEEDPTEEDPTEEDPTEEDPTEEDPADGELTDGEAPTETNGTVADSTATAGSSLGLNGAEGLLGGGIGGLVGGLLSNAGGHSSGSSGSTDGDDSAADDKSSTSSALEKSTPAASVPVVTPPPTKTSTALSKSTHTTKSRSRTSKSRHRMRAEITPAPVSVLGKRSLVFTA